MLCLSSEVVYEVVRISQSRPRVPYFLANKAGIWMRRSSEGNAVVEITVMVLDSLLLTGRELLYLSAALLSGAKVKHDSNVDFVATCLPDRRRA